MKLRRLLTLALAAAFVFVAPITAKADTETPEARGWVKDSTGWWYETLDENGELSYYADGWEWIENDDEATEDVVEYDAYYFNKDGYLQTGWIYVVDSDDDYYYTNEDGEKVYYTESWDYWMYANADGELQTGWQKIDGNWYYFEDPESYSYNYPDFVMYEDGTREIREKVAEDKYEYVPYHFARTGEMTTGWYYHTNMYGTGGSWYYSNNDGVVQTEWQKIDGVWYYFGEYSGNMYVNQWVPEYVDVLDEEGNVIGREVDEYYFVGRDGAMVTGWYNTAAANSVYGSWIFTNADGTRYDGWLKDGGAWYFIQDGRMLQNEYVYEYVTEDGKVENDTWYPSDAKDVNTYYVGRDGKMITGWYDMSSSSALGTSKSWMFASADGTIKAQWVWDGAWYFIESNGYMVADCRYECYEDGEKAPARENYTSSEEYQKAVRAWERSHYYIFDASGKMVTSGWYKVANTNYNTWLYADANGNAYTGWVNDGAWYYCNLGIMQTNTYTPDGYWVGANGVWVQ